MELADKFNLPSAILETASYKAGRRGGHVNPFEPENRLVICSYHFAAARAAEIAAVPWDLVVIDEAHRMRNVYRPDSRIARPIAATVRDRHKILLTATPLQNSLRELYGLASVVDEHVFGDHVSFREQFMQRIANEQNRDTRLRERLRGICQRTLRRQVREYVRFTERIPITQDFLPSEPEHRLYEQVSEYLQRENLVAIPASQRALIGLVLRKLLASSTFAIAVTLRRLVARLESMTTAIPLDEEDYEEIAELRDEWDVDDDAERAEQPRGPNRQAVLDELRELVTFAELAEGIGQNAKGDALLRGLAVAFAKATLLEAMYFPPGTHFRAGSDTPLGFAAGQRSTT